MEDMVAELDKQLLFRFPNDRCELGLDNDKEKLVLRITSWVSEGKQRTIEAYLIKMLKRDYPNYTNGYIII